MDHHVLVLVSVGQLVLVLHCFAHKGPSRNGFGLRPGRGSLEGDAHFRRFMRSRASPPAHAHTSIAGGACACAHRRGFARSRVVRITCGTFACAHRQRRTRTRTRALLAAQHTLIAGGSCPRVLHTRTLIASGSCARVRRSSSAAHAHACIHVVGGS